MSGKPRRPKKHAFQILGALYIILVLVCAWRVAGGILNMTISFHETLPRLCLVMMSLTVFPMTTVLLTLHTSQRLQEEINDQHGHPVGDETLSQMFHTAQLALRANDIWCRIGGEEFVALIKNTSLYQALIVAEGICSVVNRQQFLRRAVCSMFRSALASRNVCRHKRTAPNSWRRRMTRFIKLSRWTQ